MHKLIPLFLLVATSRLWADVQPLKPLAARASSERAQNQAAKVIDGDPSDASRWLSSASTTPHWIEVRLEGERELAGLHLHSGYQRGNVLRDFTVQFWREGAWVDVPSANVAGNTRHRLALRFDDNLRVRTERIRLYITGTNDGVARVGEIVVWPLTPAGVPDLLNEDQKTPVLVFLNQSGFNTGAPKRFTAPKAAEGERFEIVPAKGGAPVFTGEVRGGMGDFTAFEPGDDREYVVRVGRDRSVPFGIGDWWLERVTYQRAVDFMVDSRHHVGNDRRICQGSFGWRDDHHFGWQLNTLVPQWLSNPSAYERMPRQIVYEAPTNPKLWGRLHPPAADAPDIIKLIHWGADVIVTQGTTHELMKAQLAYFLYAWPWMKQYLPEQNYEVVRDFAFKTWAEAKADQWYPHDETPEHNLLALKTKVGSTKGGYPPGFSVQPNLMMHEVALREGRADAGLYLDAAVRQAAWMVEKLDWNDPQTTKGQRIGELVTVPGLVHLLEKYPEAAPAGLREKLQAWVDVVIRRSENMWDFRKLGDEPDRWTPTGNQPTMWNEPGNVVGVPGLIYSVLPHVEDVSKRARLEQVAWAHFDAMFGRNPTGRHFSYDAPREIEGVEKGWYSFYVGGIGRLEEARFVIDGSPKNQHYPFNPEVGNVGWTEGWIQHNTPFNLSLAYLARHSTKLSLMREGREWVIRLEAPINFDGRVVEAADVVLTLADGRRQVVRVSEEGPDSRVLSARVPVAQTGAGPVEASYGFGYFEIRTRAETRPAREETRPARGGPGKAWALTPPGR